MRVNWTKKRTDFLKENYNKIPMRQIKIKLGISRSGLLIKLKILGLERDPDAVRKFARESQYPKGHVPASKGIRGVHNSPETEFKPGIIPANTLYNGCITTRINRKRKLKMKYIRIAQGEWIELQKYIWMQRHGDIPSGHVIRFKNGDQLDVRIENLVCIPKAKHLEQNRNYNSDGYISSLLAKKDAELKEVIIRHPQLLELKRMQLKLRRAINGDR